MLWFQKLVIRVYTGVDSASRLQISNLEYFSQSKIFIEIQKVNSKALKLFDFSTKMRKYEKKVENFFFHCKKIFFFGFSSFLWEKDKLSVLYDLISMCR